VTKVIVKFDIAVFILENHQVSWSNLEKKFVKNSQDHISTRTLSKYINELVSENGMIEKVIDKETLRPVYKINERRRVFIELFRDKVRLKEAIETASKEKIPLLRELFDSIANLEVEQAKKLFDDITRVNEIRNLEIETAKFGFKKILDFVKGKYGEDALIEIIEMWLKDEKLRGFLPQVFSRKEIKQYLTDEKKS
jgi:hypothetical protein